MGFSKAEETKQEETQQNADEMFEMFDGQLNELLDEIMVQYEEIKKDGMGEMPYLNLLSTIDRSNNPLTLKIVKPVVPL